MQNAFSKIVFDFFYLLIGTFLAGMVLERVKPGLVSNYFDINKLLYVIVPMGIICILVGSMSNNKHKGQKNDKKSNY